MVQQNYYYKFLDASTKSLFPYIYIKSFNELYVYYTYFKHI